MNSSHTTVNYRENMREGIRLLQVEPDKLVDLRAWMQVSRCGTLHCAAGLFASQPFFHKQGLKAGDHGQPLFFSNGNFEPIYGPSQAMEPVFGALAFDRYFDRRSFGVWDYAIQNDFAACSMGGSPTDRELAILRLERGLKLHWAELRLPTDPVEEPTWSTT